MNYINKYKPFFNAWLLPLVWKHEKSQKKSVSQKEQDVLLEIVPKIQMDEKNEEDPFLL